MERLEESIEEFNALKQVIEEIDLENLIGDASAKFAAMRSLESPTQ